MPVDMGGLDPISVSLRDYIDGGNVAHDAVHDRERESIQAALEAHDKYAVTIVEDHFRSHEADHKAVQLAFDHAAAVLAEYKQNHKDEHEKDRGAVAVALAAVKELAQLHNTAHEREHHSHEVVHQREREAAGLARKDLDSRLQELDAQRAQVREQASHFMARTEITALIERVSLAQEAQAKAADNAHNRMDASTVDRVSNLQAQIDKLNISNAANTGASQRTTYLIGAGFTFITIIVAIVGIYLSTKGAK